MPASVKTQRNQPSSEKSAGAKAAHQPGRGPAVRPMIGADGQLARALTPADVLRLQRTVGNQATLRIIDGMRSSTATRAIQREGDDDKPKQPSKAEVTPSGGDQAQKALKGPIAASGNVLAKGGQGPSKDLHSGAGGVVQDIGTVEGLAASYLSAGIDLVNLGGAIRQAMQPKNEAEHQQALAKAGGLLKNLDGHAWNVTKSTSATVKLFNPAVHASAVGAQVVSALAIPSAYIGFANNLVATGDQIMKLDELEQVQFSLWSNPSRALAMAEGEIAVAETMLEVNKAAYASAVKLTEEQLAASKEASGVLSYLLAQRKKAEDSPEGRMAARNPDLPTVEERFANDIARWTAYAKDAEIAYQRNVETQAEIQKTLESSIFYLEAAKEKKEAREKFKSAVDAWVKEQKESGKKAEADPSKRYVPLEEIWHYAMGRRQQGIARAGVKTAAAVIGLVGGIVTLALGWTPVGWALAATAGAIALGFIGWKLGKSAMRKLGVLGKSDREVYAERLWEYAKNGYDAKGPRADAEMAHNQRVNALALLKAIGLNWSLKDVDDTTNEKAAIANIGQAMKAG